MMLFTSSTEVILSTSKFNTTNEPFGTGTRIAFEVNLPARFGWGIGFSLHYDILQFNMPRIGKK